MVIDIGNYRTGASGVVCNLHASFSDCAIYFASCVLACQQLLEIGKQIMTCFLQELFLSFLPFD